MHTIGQLYTRFSIRIQSSRTTSFCLILVAYFWFVHVSEIILNLEEFAFGPIIKLEK